MRNVIGGIQWALFLIASSIAAPIAIAHVFEMDATNTALFIQRTIFVLGVACIIQAFFGHRLPINEGPAGLWWGVFVVYAGMVGVMYPTAADSLRALQSGMLYSGALFILLAISGFISKMKKLFTPAVTFTYLLLLILQLSGTFMKGMLGIEKRGDLIDGTVFIGSVLVMLLTYVTMNHKVVWLSKYSVLISIGAGWLLFIILGKSTYAQTHTVKFMDFPDLFVFGKPIWDSGMFVTTLFITLLLVANMMASIRVMENVYKHSFSIEVPDRVKEGSIVSGINHFLAGIFSAIGPVPISGAAGFVGATKMISIKPFIVGSVIVMGITLFPSVISQLATLPAPVAYAVTFVIFTKMVEMAFNELATDVNQSQAYKVTGFGLMIGVGLMFVPAESLANLPNILSTTLSNGLITGTIITMAFEQYLGWRTKRKGTVEIN